MTTLLLLGSGGREHALAWKLAGSPEVGRVFVAPGNGGTASEPKCQNVALAPTDFAHLVAFARDQKVDFVVVGPEAPLAAGAVDAFAAADIPAFGPTAAAARIEASKAFARDFMARHGIPSPRYRIFRDFNDAAAFMHSIDFEVVVKASGLAAGKGVIVPASQEEALDALEAILLDRQFGAAGDEVVIEERLSGPEASVLAFCDGERLAMMLLAQDHKRVFDGDEGPNTGGMGAFAPAGSLTAIEMERVALDILRPTLAGLAAEGAPFRGVLFAGLMLTADGPKVLEFNCRFGDPETEALLPLLDADLLPILQDCVRGQLDPATVRWRRQTAVCVVAAAPGYPGDYAKGARIDGLDAANRLPGVKVFHAGTVVGASGGVVTNGGRVLAVTAQGDDHTQARVTAYEAMRLIRFDGMHYRRDIGGPGPVHSDQRQGQEW